ncbi:MAG: flagellar biosynthesis protein FlhA [Candidatus Gastranaerophilales bacterium]|nr:flagellar biosynthesis protein FlhA [Candidatus Gastranaerophilales bacterium]
MFKDIRSEYAVKTAPLNEPSEVELLLNTMSAEGWELYTLHEAETESGKPCYNCIFTREVEIYEEGETPEIGDIKSPLEKMYENSDEPYNQCVQVQRKMKEKKDKIKQIKSKLETVNSEEEHKLLNREISHELKNLQDMKAELSDVIQPDKMFDTIETNKITILLSEELACLADKDGVNDLLCETVKLRQKLTDELGYVIPYVKFDCSEDLESNEFEIQIRDIPAYRGAAFPNARAIKKSEINVKPNDAIESYDEISREAIYWIDEKQTKDYWEKGRSAVEYIADALEFVTVKHAEDIIDYGDINNYLDIVLRQNHYLVDSLIPEVISVGEIRYILAQLISDYVSVRDIVFIFEKIGDFASDEDEDVDIVDEIRMALSRQISKSLADEENNIACFELNDDTVDLFCNLIDTENEGTEVDVQSVEKLITKINQMLFEEGYNPKKTPIIVPVEIRAIISGVLKGFLPKIRVVAREEISKDYRLGTLGLI